MLTEATRSVVAKYMYLNTVLCSGFFLLIYNFELPPCSYFLSLHHRSHPEQLAWLQWAPMPSMVRHAKTSIVAHSVFRRTTTIHEKYHCPLLALSDWHMADAFPHPAVVCLPQGQMTGICTEGSIGHWVRSKQLWLCSANLDLKQVSHQLISVSSVSLGIMASVLQLLKSITIKILSPGMELVQY